MLSKALMKVSLARAKHTMTALILVPVPVLALAFLGSWIMGSFAGRNNDPSLDVALLVEPAIAPGAGTGAAQSDEVVENLLNWKYTDLTTGS